MKRWKKGFHVFMALLLIVAMLSENSMGITGSPIARRAVAKGKMKLSRSKLTMGSDDIREIKLKNPKQKVKWSISTKKYGYLFVVKGNKNCVCQIFTNHPGRSGKFKVTAKVGKKKFVCTVTVKDKETPKDETKDNTKDNTSNDEIHYISDRSVEYNQAYQEHRVFFSFRASEQSDRIATSGNAGIKITNNDGTVVYDNVIPFSESDFSNWTSALQGTRYLCCIRIKDSDITPGTNSFGTLELSIQLTSGAKFDVHKMSLNYLPEQTAVATVVPDQNPQEVYNKNFDTVAETVCKNGTLSRYGAYFIYGTDTYHSVWCSLDKQTLIFYYNDDSVTLKRGQTTAEGSVLLKVGTAKTTFDITKVKGDGTDTFQWNNNPGAANQSSYDAAITNVLLNADDDLYSGYMKMKNLGFTSFFR